NAYPIGDSAEYDVRLPYHSCERCPRCMRATSNGTVHCLADTSPRSSSPHALAGGRSTPHSRPHAHRTFVGSPRVSFFAEPHGFALPEFLAGSTAYPHSLERRPGRLRSTRGCAPRRQRAEVGRTSGGAAILGSFRAWHA